MNVRAAWGGVVLGLAVAVAASGAADDPPAAPSPPNAADIYRRAFAAMPELTKDEERLLQGQASPADPAELSEKLGPALQLYRQAARMPHCNWGVSLEKQTMTFQALLPHLQPLNTLAGAAAWEGERIKTADPAAFVGWHEDALRSAAHAGDGWPLVSGLIEAAMRHRSLDALSTNLALLPPDLVAELGKRLDALPPCVDFHQAMRAEKAFGIDWFIQRLVDVERGHQTAESATNFAANLRMSAMVEGGPSGFSIGLEEAGGESFWIALGQRRRGIELVSADMQRGRAILLKDGQAALVFLQEKRVEPIRLTLMTNELVRVLGDKDARTVMEGVGTNSTRLVEQLMEASDILDAAAAKTARPVADPVAWGKAIAGDVTNRNVIAAMYFPFAGHARATIDSAGAREKMLRLAVDVMQKGPSAVARSRDPWGGGGFAYRETTNGFELVSGLVRDKKPVSISVPRPR
jgi:hypothetical protein